jgi:hypothetical protein
MYIASRHAILNLPTPIHARKALKTACFHTAGIHPAAISIARFSPRWMRFAGACYPALAPTLAMLRMDHDDFEAAYRARLDDLDPGRVYRELVALAGADALLLCHEMPLVPCHRLAVAHWLETTLGIEVPELDVPVTRSIRGSKKGTTLLNDPKAVRRNLAEQLLLDLDCNATVEGDYQPAPGGWICLGAGCPGCSTCDPFIPMDDHL